VTKYLFRYVTLLVKAKEIARIAQKQVPRINR